MEEKRGEKERKQLQTQDEVKKDRKICFKGLNFVWEGFKIRVRVV